MSLTISELHTKMKTSRQTGELCWWLLMHWLVLSCFLFSSCKTISFPTAGGDRKLYTAINRTGMLSSHHMGLLIVDPERHQKILGINEDLFFTPASNTKLLTLYAALLTLPDTLVAARYVIRGDSLVLWGGGDPGILYPDPTGNPNVIDFIRQSSKIVTLSQSHFRTQRFGKGWAWDDHVFNWQCERTAFPILGNRLWISRKGDVVQVQPACFTPLLISQVGDRSALQKSEWGDRYLYTYPYTIREEQRQIPITFFPQDQIEIWSEATGQVIGLSDLVMPDITRFVSGSVRDTLLKYMMQQSDNFIAEQILLAVSLQSLGYMNEGVMIDTLLSGLMKPIADNVFWVDGSGLSRYNSMTPRSLVWVLEKLLTQKGFTYVTTIFPAGGVSGTLSEWYAGKDGHPFVFAKTGTLRYTHCLSGYIRTRSGRILIFSWMHNQVPGSLSDVRYKMQEFFQELYKRY